MKKFFKEFRDFAVKGNVINLAVGVMIGAAFQAVVTSLSSDIISPIIGIFMGQNFDSLSWTIKEGVTLHYGSFITAVIQFLITAFVLFIIIRGVNRLTSLGKKQEETVPTKKKCPFCMSEIDVKAVRCPNCTSDLSVSPAEATEKA